MSNFELPKNIERYLAALSKWYGHEGERNLQELLVNAQVRLHEKWSADNWNGGTYGHALYLNVPDKIYLGCIPSKEATQQKIKDDLNKIHNVQNEFIEEVFLEMEVAEDQDWREDSGLLVTHKRLVTPETCKRIWTDEGFRIFLSHKSEVKKETAIVKDRLRLFGMSCFVAHEDIHPTKTWQAEIENALASMDCFVALMTEKFHDSNWTDQEVGYAFARGVPLIAVRLGMDPYGFIGKFQALSTNWLNAAQDIAKLLIKNDRMFTAYVLAVRRCTSFNNGNTLAEVLPCIEKLTAEQIDELAAAYNENTEVQGSFGFNGSKPTNFGKGLAFHLTRLGSREFRFITSGKIKTSAVRKFSPV